MSEPDEAPAPARQPFYRRQWFIGVLAVIIGIFVVANLGGDGDDEEPAATDTAPATVEPTSEPAEPAEDDFDAEQYAADVETYLLESLAVDSFTETCPDVSWACPIASIEADSERTIVVTEQVTDMDEAYGEDAGRAMCNFLVTLGGEFPELQWVEVVDATGLVIGNVRCDPPR